MSKLKAGDVCLILGGHSHQTNAGKVCTIVKYVLGGESFRGEALNPKRGGAWYCEGEGLATYYIDIKTVEVHGFAFVDPKHLMKLNDPDAEITQETMEELTHE